MNFQPACRQGRFSIFNLKISRLILFLIIILAIILRFYQLGNNPPSLDWDEASLGYNAYSILKTGKDEFGRFLPISIKSFEDYKPAMYTYLSIPIIALFGLSEFSVRLPAAIFGFLTILITYFLIQELYHQHRWQSLNINYQQLALLITLLLVISPWHLQFSRIAFEANIGLFFVIAGVFCFYKGLKQGVWLIPVALSFSLSFYSYHSPRLILPLLLLGWSYFFYQNLKNQKKFIIISFFLGLIILIPFVKEIIVEGKARFTSVTVMTPDGRLTESIEKIEYDQTQKDSIGKLIHNRRIIYILAILKGYFDHFNLDFLFLSGDAPLRHHAVDMGMLYLWEAPFILLGILALVKNKYNFPLFWWFLVVPAASAITTGTPHAVRALYYLPIYQIFAAFGLLLTYQWLLKYKTISIKYQLFKTIILLIVTTNIYYYLQMYYIHSPIEAAKDWQYGFKQVNQVIRKWENQADHVIITYVYDQPHVFTLFYQQIDPSWYQSQMQGQPIEREYRKFGKYEFRRIDWKKDSKLTNTILVGSPEEIPDTASGIIKNIVFPNGEVAFRIVKV